MRQSFQEKNSTLDPKRGASGDTKPQKDQSGTQTKDAPTPPASADNQEA